jgi:hypothetical protein
MPTTLLPHFFGIAIIEAEHFVFKRFVFSVSCAVEMTFLGVVPFVY